jgi:hypothetical protein
LIRYSLLCDVEHSFEAWFSSSNGYDEQSKSGLVSCPFCGSLNVKKAIMAPMVAKSKGDSSVDAARFMAEAAHRYRTHVEQTFDYVGDDFASEARDMHQGLALQRPIYGEASGPQIKSLIEEGVPVAPLPPNIPIASLPSATTQALPAPLPMPNLPKSRLN